MVGKRRDDLVFTDMRGGVLRNSNFRARVFKRAVESCQLVDETFPSITPHDLRHTAASLSARQARMSRHCSGCWDTRRHP